MNRSYVPAALAIAAIGIFLAFRQPTPASRTPGTTGSPAAGRTAPGAATQAARPGEGRASFPGVGATAAADPQRNRDYEDYLADLTAFTGESRDQILAKIAEGPRLMADEWNSWESQGAMTPERIKAFYKQTPNYPYDLARWHFMDQKRSEDVALVKRVVEEFRAKNVLDFGAGVGLNALPLARAGVDVTMADLDSKTLAFAVFHAQKRGLPVKVWKSDVEPMPPDRKYDLILALHVFDLIPKEELRSIVEKLIQLKHEGTRVIVEAPFGRSAGHPMKMNADEEVRALLARLESELPPDAKASAARPAPGKPVGAKPGAGKVLRPAATP